MIKNLKELERLLKLCRKQGVTQIKFGTTEVKLGDLPTKQVEAIETDPVDPFSSFPQGDLTPEQLLFYSSGGNPADDPYKDS